MPTFPPEWEKYKAQITDALQTLSTLTGQPVAELLKEYSPAEMIALIKAEESNPVTAYMGMAVDLTKFGRPVPIVMLGWDDDAMTRVSWQYFRTIAKGSPTKRTRWHKFPDPDSRPLRTERLLVQLSYREREGEGYIVGAVRDRGRRHDQPLVWDCRIPNGQAIWYEWKATYQRCGYYLLACGKLTKDKVVDGYGDWEAFYGGKRTPMFLIEDIDYTEIGSFETLNSELERARDRLLIPDEYLPGHWDERMNRAWELFMKASDEGDEEYITLGYLAARELPPTLYRQLMQKLDDWVKEQRLKGGNE